MVCGLMVGVLTALQATVIGANGEAPWRIRAIDDSLAAANVAAPGGVVPVVGDGVIGFGGGFEIGMSDSLTPWIVQGSRAYQIGAHDGSADVIAQVQEGGGPQVLLNVRDASAPTAFRLRLPERTLLLLPDGGVLATAESGESVRLEPPWAHDSVGNSVPTSYTVEGDTLVQHLAHRGHPYPVLADPSVRWCFFALSPGICVKYSRSEVQEFYNAIVITGVGGAAATAEYACARIKNLGWKAECKAVVAVYFADYINTFRQAQQQRRCVEVTIPTPPSPIRMVIERARVVNC